MSLELVVGSDGGLSCQCHNQSHVYLPSGSTTRGEAPKSNRVASIWLLPLHEANRSPVVCPCVCFTNAASSPNSSSVEISSLPGRAFSPSSTSHLFHMSWAFRAPTLSSLSEPEPAFSSLEMLPCSRSTSVSSSTHRNLCSWSKRKKPWKEFTCAVVWPS